LDFAKYIWILEIYFRFFVWILDFAKYIWILEIDFGKIYFGFWKKYIFLDFGIIYPRFWKYFGI